MEAERESCNERTMGEEDMCTRGSDLPPRSMAHSLKVIHINTQWPL